VPAAALQLDHIIVGRDLTIRELTIQQYSGAELRPNSANHNRQAMIKRVWTTWITGLLQPSLPHDTLLDLGLTERPAMIARTLDLYVQRPDLADRVQAPGTQLIDVFDRLDRALLILGAPGAGKTTLLLVLARDLLQRAAQDPVHPIPVVFPLSSWARQRRPLAVWLVDALNELYEVPRKIGQAWVEADQILPLLDGLDEVAPEHRTACVEAINAFRQDHGLLPVVVCSRVADYEALGTRLRLHGALVVQPLTPQQLDSYLTQIGTPLAGVRLALSEDPALGELLDTPLMLTILTLAYAEGPAMARQPPEAPEIRHQHRFAVDVETVEERRRHIFATYVERMFARAVPVYSKEQAMQWLSWLAQRMIQHSQTILLLEHLQPSWLLTRGQRGVYVLSSRLAGGVIFGLSLLLLGFGGNEAARITGAAVTGTLGFGLMVGLISGCLDLLRLERNIKSIEVEQPPRPWQDVIDIVIYTLIGGLLWGVYLVAVGAMRSLTDATQFVADAMQVGVTSALSYKLIFGPRGSALALTRDVQTVETLRWSLAGALKFGILGMVGGTALGLLSVLSIMKGGGKPHTGLIMANLVGGLIAGGIIGMLYGGLKSGRVEMTTSPNQGIKLSIRNAVSLGLIIGLIGGVLWYPTLQRAEPMRALLAGVGIGLVGSQALGFRTVIRHYLIRFILWQSRSTPRNYTSFLEYAVRLTFLQKVGGGYIFIHRLLQDYFAGRYTALGGAAHQELAERKPSSSSRNDRLSASGTFHVR
jgi:DNA polymerase III delta prime subunit